MVDVHPLVVHFPIALLTMYSFLEILRFRILREKQYFFYVKATILILGVPSAFVALAAGLLAVAERGGVGGVLLKTHSNFAYSAKIVYASLAILYAILWARKSAYGRKLETFPAYRLAWNIAHFVIETPFVFIPALAGLLLMVVTGSLGAAMVYGPDFDPIVEFIYDLLVPR